jgi:hypothetical protein
MMKSSNVSLGNSSVFTSSKYPSGFDSSVEGRSGAIQVGYDNTFSGVVSPWVESFVKVGAVLNQDPVRDLTIGLIPISHITIQDNGNNIGVFNGAHSVDDNTGNRSSATSGYLVPNLNRPNLLVLTGAMVGVHLMHLGRQLTPFTKVSQVTFSKKTPPLKASGVRYIVNGTTYTAMAAREVIISAGKQQSYIFEVAVTSRVAFRDYSNSADSGVVWHRQ